MKPVEFLTSTRFKLTFNKSGNCTNLSNFTDELEGQWVWLVDATDGKNDPLFTKEDLRMEALMAVRQQNERVEAALTRQTENMAFVLNHAPLPEPWYQKLKAELEQDREHLPATPIIEDAGSGA